MGIEKQRLVKDKTELIKGIDKLKKEYVLPIEFFHICFISYNSNYRYGDSEHAQKKEKREADLHQIKEKFESLDSSRKVSEHQVEQLKNALIQLKNETAAVRSESTRTHNTLGKNFNRWLEQYLT